MMGRISSSQISWTFLFIPAKNSWCREMAFAHCLTLSLVVMTPSLMWTRVTLLMCLGSRSATLVIS